MDEKSKLEEITDNLKQYASTNIELVKLEVIEKASNIVPAALSATILSIIVYLGILFLSLGLSIYLCVLSDSFYMGFVWVGILYLVIGLILIFLRKKVLNHPIRNALIKVVFKQKQD